MVLIYGLFLFFMIVLGYFFSDYVIVKKAKRWHSVGKKKGYHVHHSMYGVALFLLTPFTYGNLTAMILLTGLGIGIIIEHTYHESFVFIEKM